MQSILKYKTFFAYSKKINKYFFTKFEDGINIIYGRNTSGKSTLIQSILYTFGINDVAGQLSEILNEDIIFRLDCELKRPSETINLVFIREGENIYIKKNHELVKSFYGISGNSSAEHSKLKEYLHNIFIFTLKLEQKNEYKAASTETMFLPYYISQSTGWVYLRKSFSNLDFYKNFKFDYLDYCLGIENNIDRVAKQKLEKEREYYEKEINFYNEFGRNDELTLTKISDENFINQAKSYTDEYKEQQNKLVILENEYILECNKLNLYTTRLTILNKIQRNHRKQNPENGICPICDNQLKFSTESFYSFHQDANDTKCEIDDMKNQQKNTQGTINSISKQIKKIKLEIKNKYTILKKYNEQEITFESWLNNKSNEKLIENIESKLESLETNLTSTKQKLQKYKTEDEIEKLRNEKDLEFSKIFRNYLSNLGIKNILMNEYKYTTLYKTSAFPLQGVELHKAVLAHNFAFNKIIHKTEYIHRFPFLLDAVFKEDIDEENKISILKFINDYQPKDTQSIISIAHAQNTSPTMMETYNKAHFNNKANLICIGESSKERAFLRAYDTIMDPFLDETFKITES